MARRYWIYRPGESDPIGQHFEREGAARLAASLLEQETGEEYEVHPAPSRWNPTAIDSKI